MQTNILPLLLSLNFSVKIFALSQKAAKSAQLEVFGEKLQLEVFGLSNQLEILVERFLHLYGYEPEFLHNWKFSNTIKGL